jgi:flagellar motility protein MotE (MotC chaperone)
MIRHFHRPRLLPLTIAAMAVLLLVKSAVLVRAAVPAAAHATPAEPAKPAAAAQELPAPPSTVAPAAPIACAAPPVSDDERKLLLDLRHRSAELDARGAGLAAREGVLAAAEKRIGARVVELTSLQQRLESLNTARKAREDANWQGLVKLYEAMKPRDAAAIFNDLDKNVLVQVLDRMNERKAAPVLAAMQPERARQVTAELAQLRAGENRVPPARAGKTGG